MTSLVFPCLTASLECWMIGVSASSALVSISGSDNKAKLQKCIRNWVIVHSQHLCPNIIIYLSSTIGHCVDRCQSILQGVSTDHPEMDTKAEEADTQIIQHSSDAVKQGNTRLVILSGDTDVVVPSLYYWFQLHECGLQELWQKAGVDNTTRYMPIHKLASSHGQELCSVLSAVHSITGCDSTSKFGTKQAALSVNPVKFLTAFGAL